MRKKSFCMLVSACMFILIGCTKEDTYDFKHYNEIFKDIQQSLKYEDTNAERAYMLTIQEFNASFNISYEKSKQKESLIVSGISNPGDTYYSLEKDEKEMLNFNGCSVSFDGFKEVKDSNCSSDKIARIKKDKEKYTKYFLKYKITGKGLYQYCGEVVEKNKDDAKELDRNNP